MAVDAAPAPVAAPPGPTAPARPVEAERPRRISGRAPEEISSLVGALVSSLALTWLLYDRLLPFSGWVGFFLVWYVAFLGLHLSVTAIGNPRTVVVDRLATAVVNGAAAVVGAALVWTIVYVFVEGFPAYRHLNFFTHDMSGVSPTAPFTQGGIEHAIVGSLVEILIAVVLSMPLGVVTAIYLAEVGGRFSRIVRTVVEAMTALPDLVAGLFIYAVLIVALHQGRTGGAAALALAITMLPIIARSAEVALRVVPDSLREASAALGAPRWRTTWNVVLPAAAPGLATALILGIARGIGETAPVIITSNATSYFNLDPRHNPMSSLPLFGYTAIRSGEVGSFETRGFGALAVLLGIVLVLFVVVRLLARLRAGRS